MQEGYFMVGRMGDYVESLISLGDLTPWILVSLLIASGLPVLGAGLILHGKRRRNRVALSLAHNSSILPVITAIQITEDRSTKISQLAAWFNLTVVNKGPVPVVIKEIYVQYHNSRFEESRPIGMFRNVEGAGETVSVGDSIRTPLTLDAGEALLAHVLLPIPVSEELGKLLARTNTDLLFRSEWFRKEIDESIQMMSRSSAPGFIGLKTELGIKSVEVRDSVLHRAEGRVSVRANAGYLPSCAWRRVLDAVEDKHQLKCVNSPIFTGLTVGLRNGSKQKIEAFIPTAKCPFSFTDGMRAN